MEIPELYNLYLKQGKVSTDTRKIEPGSIFFALKGDNFDGSDFIDQAFYKGAEWAVTQSDEIKGDKIIKVNDTLETLQQLAAFHRVSTGIKILAITGSNGKTTTKELIRAVLSKKFRVYATEGNLNNHIGVPLTLLSMTDHMAVGIVEMGANHPGEIAFLCGIAKPDYGLITNIGKAHLEGFGGIEGVARTKGELFDFLETNNGTRIVNQGNKYVKALVSDDSSNVIRYNGSGSIRSLNVMNSRLLEFHAVLDDETVTIRTNLIGGYNIENVLAACTVGRLFEVSTPDIIQALSEYQPAGHRSQLIDTGRNRIFMDSYNANPSSMAAALNEFLTLDGNKMLILGEMAEVGATAAEEHEAVLTLIEEGDIACSDVICVGESFRMPAGKYGFIHFSETGELAAYLEAHPVNGKFILIKGSRVNRLEKLLPYL